MKKFIRVLSHVSEILALVEAYLASKKATASAQALKTAPTSYDVSVWLDSLFDSYIQKKRAEGWSVEINDPSSMQ